MLGALPWLASGARAADAPPTAADFARLQADLARLQQEVREQRQLIFQLMQMDQQRYDLLMKFMQNGPGGSPPALPGMPGMPPAGAGEGGAGKGAPGAGAGAASAPGGRDRAQTGTISGRVLASGGTLAEAYVYVEGLKGAPARGTTIEIRQRDKQFVPSVVVVPVGTRVLFPNQDAVIHNVFSRTPGDSFDLGVVKNGDKPEPVVLLKPGHVEVFCNIHSKMRSDILVVPNQHWVRVRADGSFQIPDVPVGSRRVVLWSPTATPVAQRVDVTAAGATTTLNATVTPLKAHPNKMGQAYGSYDE